MIRPSCPQKSIKFRQSVSLHRSGVTKGPADPAVRGGGGGAILGGRQIVVWKWDNFENLTKVLAKLRILL